MILNCAVSYSLCLPLGTAMRQGKKNREVFIISNPDRKTQLPNITIVYRLCQPPAAAMRQGSIFKLKNSEKSKEK